MTTVVVKNVGTVVSTDVSSVGRSGMPDDRSEQIAARVAAATPGPWGFGCYGKSWAVFQHDETNRPKVFGWTPDAGSLMPSEADAEFIAHARSDVPWLLEENERLLGDVFAASDLIARYMQTLEAIAGCSEWSEGREVELARAALTTEARE
jgi:hypothetical protein